MEFSIFGNGPWSSNDEGKREGFSSDDSGPQPRLALFRMRCSLGCLVHCMPFHCSRLILMLSLMKVKVTSVDIKGHVKLSDTAKNLSSY